MVGCDFWVHVVGTRRMCRVGIPHVGGPLRLVVVQGRVWWNAGSRVRFEEVPVTITEAGTGAGGGGRWEKNPGPVPVGQVRTQRELILEAVEALETLLGQGVGEQLEVLLQSPTHPPASPTELERAQQLTSLLGHRNRIEKKKHRMGRPGVDKAKATLAKAETWRT